MIAIKQTRFAIRNMSHARLGPKVEVEKMVTGGEHWIQQVHNWLVAASPDLPSETVRSAIAAADSIELESLLGVLEHHLEWLAASPIRTRVLFQLLAARVLFLNTSQAAGVTPAEIDADLLSRIYECLVERELTEAAAHALQMLSSQSDDASMEAIAGILCNNPPEQWEAAGLGLSPLWRAGGEELEHFFGCLDEDTLHPATLSVLLDLANYSVRTRKLARHPWQNRAGRISSLLSAVVKQLKQLECDPGKFGASVEQIQQTLGDSVSLTVALCDALALIGDHSAQEALVEAMSISHRRIQTEAAGALASLGIPRGKMRLLDLASDRAARARAVAYAEELGFIDEIEPELRSPAALAESGLASWLAAPEQFGVPPQDMELIDSRTQYWPSYEEPQDCFLFRFTYHLPAGQISNIGIAGPLTQVFTADLANLPVDDIYAAFAGWQAEHDEIFEVPVSELNPAQRREVEKIEQSLASRGLDAVEPIALTLFFGEVAVLAKASHEGKSLCTVSDGQELLYYPMTTSPTSINPELVLCIFRGRKLLRTFNP